MVELESSSSDVKKARYWGKGRWGGGKRICVLNSSVEVERVSSHSCGGGIDIVGWH